MNKQLYNYMRFIFAACLMMTSFSCRESSDDVLCYAYDDRISFAEAETSLEGQFKAIWTAMNCNYPMWDYEEQNGTDWDNVYETYVVRFKELDQEYNKQNPVPDSKIYDLYDEIFAPLHDGHLVMYLKNIHTGKKIEKSIVPHHETDEESTSGIALTMFILDIRFTSYYKSEDVSQLMKENDYIFACFKDNIVYFRVPSFHLNQAFAERSQNNQKERICKLWEAWFNCVQKLQENNSLKGIIIDIRNNPGGESDDYQYVLGALHNGNAEWNDDSQNHIIGYLREKTGIGRRDFSQIYPFTFQVYDKHVCVDAPIVMLVNGLSASTAECTCLSAKQLKNGYVIGEKTYGAFSPLANIYAVTYSGTVGDSSLGDRIEKTSYFAPFYIYMPCAAFLSLEKEFLDGSGIEPDEIVHLNLTDILNGKDNQLERALEYIRTGK